MASNNPMMSPYRQMGFNAGDQQQPTASSSNQSPRTVPSASGPSLPQSSFRAPAHKHAHHLHSIPPREKSTRTLIIDHMLWVHARTRFAQSRAELGMTDRTGGQGSPNYIHRTRPESYEEEDEDGSEGEDALVLRARAGDPQRPYNGDEEDRLGNQDLVLARSLRLRAEGLEKVVISMLEQPPPIHPVNDEDILTPPTSPKLNASNHTHPHRLPNGVRLRLALGTIINDLFARQAPPPPYRHTHIPNSKVSTPQDHSPPPIPSPSDLPHALTTLAPVSGAFAVAPQPPSLAVPPRAMQKAHYTDYQQTYSYNQPNMNMPYPSNPQQPQQPSYQNRLHPSSRTRSLYAVGADPRTANSPPSLRCPRHLHTGCEICVEAKSPTPARQSGGTNFRAGRAAGFASDRHGANSWKAMPGGVGPGGGGITGWQDGSGIGSGLLRPGVRGSALWRKVLESDPKTGSGNTKLSKLIPRFIRLSALVAAELGRESRGEEDESEDGGSGGRARSGSSVASGSGSTSAPGAGSGGQNEAGTWNTAGGSGSSPFPAPSSPLARRTSLQAQAQDRASMYEFALRPSLEWYMLLAGLLTRAVLEGYLAGGWKGIPAVQCLLLVGLGINENAGRKDEEEEGDEEDDSEQFAGFDPDELPDLVEAVKILFPSLRDSASGQKGKAEEEYEIEMLKRLQRFHEIPSSTPDCATHLEDLAWQYPAEPVERAAVRFCEAIAKWRGKPELETYKKKPMPRVDPPQTPGAMTIESLVHSNPTSPVMAHTANQGPSSAAAAAAAERRRRLKKPSIDVYFTQMSISSRRESGSWNAGIQSNKRFREDDGGRTESAKRVYSSSSS
ncbi:hypothetical protein M413DRAFT_11545 [Hebeloma cylindrosporum]|uniref:Uncharacterized protein n=1 Tax=Hebeloma cylindrosporum TaxID=76867 RepID=A0A0C3CAV0_HEBCY|nr:hypothetical protein M413DRAFT_11545 [Hebeloma cylindrosporum h7]